MNKNVREGIEALRKELEGIPLNPPISSGPIAAGYFADRISRKKAMLEGEAFAVAKARGEKEVRENTKKRGPTIQIEVGV